MTNLKIFIHSYNRLDDIDINDLTIDELKYINCYTVEKYR
jgi:hypothetical protein